MEGHDPLRWRNRDYLLRFRVTNDTPWLFCADCVIAEPGIVLSESLRVLRIQLFPAPHCRQGNRILLVARFAIRRKPPSAEKLAAALTLQCRISPLVAETTCGYTRYSRRGS